MEGVADESGTQNTTSATDDSLPAESDTRAEEKASASLGLDGSQGGDGTHGQGRRDAGIERRAKRMLARLLRMHGGRVQGGGKW